MKLSKSVLVMKEGLARTGSLEAIMAVAGHYMASEQPEEAIKYFKMGLREFIPLFEPALGLGLIGTQATPKAHSPHLDIAIKNGPNLLEVAKALYELNSLANYYNPRITAGKEWNLFQPDVTPEQINGFLATLITYEYNRNVNDTSKKLGYAHAKRNSQNYEWAATDYISFLYKMMSPQPGSECWRYMVRYSMVESGEMKQWLRHAGFNLCTIAALKKGSSNNPELTFNVTLMYLKGLGVEKNIQLAIETLAKIANVKEMYQELPALYIELFLEFAKVYLSGQDGIPVDYQKAKHYLEYIEDSQVKTFLLNNADAFNTEPNSNTTAALLANLEKLTLDLNKPVQRSEQKQREEQEPNRWTWINRIGLNSDYDPIPEGSSSSSRSNNSDKRKIGK